MKINAHPLSLLFSNLKPRDHNLKMQECTFTLSSLWVLTIITSINFYADPKILHAENVPHHISKHVQRISTSHKQTCPENVQHRISKHFQRMFHII